MLRYLLTVSAFVIVSVFPAEAQESLSAFIAGLPAATPLSGSELIIVIQGGVLKAIPVSAVGTPAQVIQLNQIIDGLKAQAPTLEELQDQQTVCINNNLQLANTISEIVDKYANWSTYLPGGIISTIPLPAPAPVTTPP